MDKAYLHGRSVARSETDIQDHEGKSRRRRTCRLAGEGERNELNPSLKLKELKTKNHERKRLQRRRRCRRTCRLARGEGEQNELNPSLKELPHTREGKLTSLGLGFRRSTTTFQKKLFSGF